MLVGAVAVSEVAVSEDQILTRCESLVPTYMVPQRVLFFPCLPKNDNGKIDRKAIKAAILTQVSQGDE
jgi:acyl-CoA synthetase (AMP-forming)/AMP-acid ligase II